MEFAGAALLSELLVWGGASVLTLAVYLASSLDDFPDLLLAAIDAAAPAMWLVPAMLLLSSLTPLSTAAGLLLVANTARILSSGKTPQKRRARRTGKTPEPPARIFRSADVQCGRSSQTIAAILGALALQAGVWAACAGEPLWAAGLFAAGSWSWTRSSIATGAYQPRRHRNLLRSLFSVVLVLLLATLVSVGQTQMDDQMDEDAPGGGIAAPSRRAARRLMYGREPKAKSVEPTAPRVIGGPEDVALAKGKGIPGVILRPTGKPAPQRAILSPVSNTAWTLGKPVTIPFTGEYHLFRALSGQVPERAHVEAGTPLEFVYMTLAGGAMQTEAVQPLYPPMDFASCGRVEMNLLFGDDFPVVVALELVSGNRVESLGSEILGAQFKAEETLSYVVPAAAGRPPVTALHIVFIHDPKKFNSSAKVAIRSFTFFPSLSHK